MCSSFSQWRSGRLLPHEGLIKSRHHINLSLRALCLHLKEVEFNEEDDSTYEELHSRQRQLLSWGVVPVILLALSSEDSLTYSEALQLANAMLNGGPREVGGRGANPGCIDQHASWTNRPTIAPLTLCRCKKNSSSS